MYEIKYDNSEKSVIEKIKDETEDAAIEEFVGLKATMYSFFVDKNEFIKAKGVNKNAVGTISHNEYKDALLNNKCLRHSMNRIQSKDHKIETYKINKISKFCLNDKIYMNDKKKNMNGLDQLLNMTKYI